MKRLFYIFFIPALVVLISGCSLSAGTSPTEEDTSPTVPAGAVSTEKGRTLKLSDEVSLKLPNSLSFGSKELNNISGEKAFFSWESDEEFILPSSNNVMFYAFSGNDKKTPAAELTASQVRTSVSGYIKSFSSQVDEARLSIDAGITENDNWYTLCFTGYGGSTNEVTSYGSYCYPKTFYGIYVLQKNLNEDYSRDYYGFVFSNDSCGEILSEDDYNDLMGQIKDVFGISKFFTLPQIHYDAATDHSDGYTYDQLTNLFLSTKNFYIIRENLKPSSADSETEEGTRTSSETTSECPSDD